MIFECDPATVVDRQHAAWQARDADALAASYAPDAVIVDFPDAVISTGRDAIQAQYAGNFARTPTNRKVSIRTRIVSGEYVIDEEVFAIAGREIDAVVIHRVQNCLIVRTDFMPAQGLFGSEATQ